MSKSRDTDAPPVWRGLTGVKLLSDASLDVGFTLAERQLLVEEALKLITDLYVHLPLKRAMRAVDPERRLRLLALQVTEELEDAPAEQVTETRPGLAGLGLRALEPRGLEEFGLDALFAPSELATLPGAAASELDGFGLEALLQPQTTRGSELEGFGLDALIDATAPSAPTPTPTPGMSDGEFHDELLDVFASLCDLHTRYISPDPLRRCMAFLPFLVEECWERDGRGQLEQRYLVTKVVKTYDFGKPSFVRGVQLTHWNGVPIARAVQRRAERSHGANPESAHARGIEALTCRWLGTTAPPDEEWVVVRYLTLDRKAFHQVKVPWRIGTLPRPSEAEDDAAAGRATCIGLDPQSEMRRRAKYELYFSDNADLASAAGLPGRDAPRFGCIKVGGAEVDYLRIHTFAVRNVAAFIGAIERELRRRHGKGLVIDVRGNPGGDILAAEQLLALLCPRGTVPQQLHFRVTPTARKVAQRLGPIGGPDSRVVIDSMRFGLRSGEAYSRGSAVGRVRRQERPAYDGDMVLVVDALCYSATEVFAAGFQDNGLGQVLGTARRTGGGAGNSWEYDAVRHYGGAEHFSVLPKGAAGDRTCRPASFVVAVRRMTRSGPGNGETFEETGVVPDGEPYKMTRDDLMNHNRGLLATAARMLIRA